MDLIIRSVHPKHAKIVNKAYKAWRAYHKIVNAIAEGNSLISEATLERNASRNFDKYEDLCLEMPARERANLAKQCKLLHGYD